MQEEDFETTIKVIVVGNGGVGKTSMIKRFCTGEYTDKYKKTIGVDFLEKEHFIPSIAETATMMLWDTAGQEEFDSVTRTYYRGAGAAVLAFSTVDRDSFEAIEKWKQKVENECSNIAMVLVQTKVDLLSKAVVTSEEAEGLAKKLGLKFYRTCCAENMNVDKVFEYLGEQYVKNTRKKAGSGLSTQSSSIGGTLPSGTTKPASADTSIKKAESGGAATSSDAKKDSTTAAESGASFKVQKPKQRTGGKKTPKCVIL